MENDPSAGYGGPRLLDLGRAAVSNSSLAFSAADGSSSLHYAEGSLMPVLFAKLVLSRVPLLGSVPARKFQRIYSICLAAEWTL